MKAITMSGRTCMHVKKNGKHAKFWLVPSIELEFSRRYRPHEVNEVSKLVQRHRDEFLEAWNGFFGGGT
jgi:hypothetical protein